MSLPISSTRPFKKILGVGGSVQSAERAKDTSLHLVQTTVMMQKKTPVEETIFRESKMISFFLFQK